MMHHLRRESVSFSFRHHNSSLCIPQQPTHTQLHFQKHIHTTFTPQKLLFIMILQNNHITVQSSLLYILQRAWVTLKQLSDTFYNAQYGGSTKIKPYLDQSQIIAVWWQLHCNSHKVFGVMKLAVSFSSTLYLCSDCTNLNYTVF